MKFFWFMLLDKLFASSGGLMSTQRAYGRFKVIYSDGQHSQPMTYNVAKGYASIFDGKVVLK